MHPNQLETREYLQHLPSNMQREIHLIKEIIIKSIKPARIYLYGPPADVSISMESLSFIKNIDLLVITDASEKAPQHEIQDLLEARCEKFFPVSIFVNNVCHQNDRARNGSYFYFLIQKTGILLYDSGLCPFEYSLEPDYAEVALSAEADFHRWHAKARVFYKCAVCCLEENNYAIAAFNLHQVAEIVYHSVLLTYLRYRAKTHNLDKLKNYANNLSIMLSMVFPLDTDENIHHFELLRSAYVGGRYGDDTFIISRHEIGYLMEQVGALVNISENICLNKIASFKKMIK